MTLPSPREIAVIGSMNAPDVLAWPVTARMSDLTRYDGDGKIWMQHSKTGQWPRVPIADDGTLSEGNLWGIALYQGRWYARTLHHIRPGQTEKTYPINEWGQEREPLVWGTEGPPLAVASVVGLFCSTRARYGRAPVQERTDIVWLRIGGGILAREAVGEEPPPPPPDEPPPGPDDPEGPIVIELPQLTEILEALAPLRAQIEALTAVARDLQQNGIKIRWR